MPYTAMNGAPDSAVVCSAELQTLHLMAGRLTAACLMPAQGIFKLEYSYRAYSYDPAATQGPCDERKINPVSHYGDFFTSKYMKFGSRPPRPIKCDRLVSPAF